MKSQLEKEIQKLKEKAKDMAKVKEKINMSLASKQALETELQTQKQLLYSSQELSHMNAMMKIDYKTPSGDFDKRNVIGKVIGLFDPKDNKY